MQMYGAYQADPPDGDICWFTTGESVQPGDYVRGDGPAANVCIAESVAALILQVGPVIEVVEKSAQQNLNVSGMDKTEVRERMAAQLTDELIARLTNESDSIWEANPRWIKHLKPSVKN